MNVDMDGVVLDTVSTLMMGGVVVVQSDVVNVDMGGVVLDTVSTVMGCGAK